MGVFGAAVITLLTVQNSRRASIAETVRPDLVAAQIDAVIEDMQPGAAKTGALGNAAIIRAIAAKAARFEFPLVVDPVMVGTRGLLLLEPEAQDALVADLIPAAFLVTPNLSEAERLAGIQVDNKPAMEEAARRIADLGVRAVLVKGGHLKSEALDVLYYKGRFHHYSVPRIDTRHTHGTGCTYSAAITAELAKGRQLPEAVETAKKFITEAIKTAPGLGLGSGPVNHFAHVD
jgi:hydroxymethylpyrimidine/phosphomethylpyrimidine kinase